MHEHNNRNVQFQENVTLVNWPLANTSLSNSLLANCFLWKIPLKHGSHISFKARTNFFFLRKHRNLKSKKVTQVFQRKTKRKHYYSLEKGGYIKLEITVSKESLTKDKLIRYFIIIRLILVRLLKLKLMFM